MRTLTPALLTGAFTALTAAMTVVALFVDIPTSPGDPPMYVTAPIESCMCMVPTVLYGVAAIGVFRRKICGWYMGLIGLLMCMRGCLAPLALFGNRPPMWDVRRRVHPPSRHQRFSARVHSKSSVVRTRWRREPFCWTSKRALPSP